MMPITLFKSISYPSQNQKASFKYAENISKQIQQHDIDRLTKVEWLPLDYGNDISKVHSAL